MRRLLLLLVALVALSSAACTPQQVEAYLKAASASPSAPRDFEDLSPAQKCERVQVERVAYVGAWPMECRDGAIRRDGRMGECACWPGLPRESFRIVLRTDDLNPADPEGDLAYRMAHEFGHAWYATFAPDEIEFDGTPAYASEGRADDFARRHVRPRA